MQIASIDIGSNAIRLIIGKYDFTESYSKPNLVILKKFREPIRLGAEVFEHKKISPQTISLCQNVFLQFQNELNKYQVKKVKAYGTSALRDAQNKDEFIKAVFNNSKIQVQVISGEKEASLIQLAIEKQMDISSYCCLLIDIGGGSMELTILENSKKIKSLSFQLGTVRVLEQLKKLKLKESQVGIILSEYLPAIVDFFKTHHTPFDFAIGTGGNFECMSDLKNLILKTQPKTILSHQDVVALKNHVSNLNLEERVKKLKLRPDRADVINIALHMTELVLRQAETQKLVVPHVGLRDGILWEIVQNL